MTIFDFMSGHPFVSVVVLMILCGTIVDLVRVARS